MRIKYLIILLLTLFLGIIIYKLLKIEDSIRKSKIVEVVLEDESKPLMEEITDEALKKIALNSKYNFIAEGDYFSALSTQISRDKIEQVWEEIFLKGVNMGVALPDKFPSEFAATYEDYLEWFVLIGKMNSNTIRTYTILPPEFYEALAWYNVHYENRKLYLLQGVWAKEPPDDNCTDPSYTRAFMKEIKDAVDVIHGNAVIQPVHGHAAGVYAHDVSAYTIGFILGREWEPFIVTKTNQNENIDINYGLFIDVLNPTPMEKWLAGIMEFAARYETQTYMEQRPLSFVNWLPLDPMYHNSEYIESDDIKEFDNDLESIDMEKYSATNYFRPGVFASYHVYPYYPDFIFQERKYRQTLNHRGNPDNYLAYLQDLKNHQQGMPLLIAEYGVPSSRGNSHYTPFGYHQGGYSEKEQAEVSVLMTENISLSGCAGAIYFAWIDEWFKNNWLVQDFEQPQERRKKWHNMENPEQNYGVMALETRKIEIDGSPDDWGRMLKKPFVAADYDPAYFYISGFFPEVNFRNHSIYIVIDSHDQNRGSFRLPFQYPDLRYGAEFLVEISDRDHIRILVDQHYDIYTDRAKQMIPDYRTVKNYDGSFVDQFLLSNRARTDILGDTFPETKHHRGKLIFGNSGKPETSNADIIWTEDGFLELRLTWQLLNVTDPSSRSVLEGNPETGGIDFAETNKFNLLFIVTDKNKQVTDVFPNNKKLTYTWDFWETPEYVSRIKPVYHALTETFKALKPLDQNLIHDISPIHKFTLCDFYHGNRGAISLAMDGRCYSQYSNALPVLKKYNLKATFSKSEYEKTRTGGTQFRKMLENEFKKIVEEGHELRTDNSWFDDEAGKSLKVPPAHRALPYVLLQNDSLPGIQQIFRVLNEGINTWTIFMIRHLYKPGTREFENLLHLSGKDVANISPVHFERFLRLCRNSGYWIAPLGKVASYIYIRENSGVKITELNRSFLVVVSNSLSDEVKGNAVTILYQGPAKILKITGSASDGIFNTRGGKLYFDVFPNNQATVEIID